MSDDGHAVNGEAAAGAEEDALRLGLAVVLPDVRDLQDACIDRLIQLLESSDGVRRVHVVHADELPLTADEAELCLHYDPGRLTLGSIRALARSAGAEVTDRYAHSVIGFHLVGAEDYGSRLEENLKALPGVTAAVVNFPSQLARVEYDRRETGPRIIEQALRDAGATSIEFQDETETAGERTQRAITPSADTTLTATGDRETAEDEGDAGWYHRNRELAWSLASGAFLIAGWLIGPLTPAPQFVSTVLYGIAYVFGARDNVQHFIGDLKRGHFRFNIDLLMVVAAIGAAALGEWAEGALLLFLFSLGHALEHYALGRARSAIGALGELSPQSALVLRQGSEVSIPVDAVVAGDRVVVKPAERIAVDGTVEQGMSSVNQAPITGESVPVDKKPGDAVFAGSVNGDGALVVLVTAAIGDRTLDRVIRLVAEAQTQKAPTQRLTDRFEQLFVPLVLIGDALLIVVPPLLGLSSWSESFYRAMAVLVAASPCALALGTPAAVLAGIAQAARNGVLIKGGAYLETLGTIKVLALDKTGTITVGEPWLTDLVPFADTTDEVLLSTAASVERRSQHPVAMAVMRAAEERAVPVRETGELESVTGRGVRATLDGAVVEIGRSLMFEEKSIVIPQIVRDTVARLEANGRTTMIVRRSRKGQPSADNDWLGVLGVADEPRIGVRETLVGLRRAGIERIVMLTGDNAVVGKAIGDAAGIDEVRANLLPEDKVNALRELAGRGPVAMVGDGVNDAPALAHATVGIAMGGAGTAAALETADIALMGDDLGRLPFAVGLSHRARKVIRQNLYVSLGVIIVLLIATATGTIGIGPAVVAHEGSTLIVIANALRLLAYK